jgi:hypothetical protein
VHSKSLVTDCDVDKSVWSGGGGNVSKTADCCDAHGLGLVGCEVKKSEAVATYREGVGLN